MGKNRLAGIETYGLATIGFVRGVCKELPHEIADRLHDRQNKAAPEVGEIILAKERENDLPKAA